MAISTSFVNDGSGNTSGNLVVNSKVVVGSEGNENGETFTYNVND